MKQHPKPAKAFTAADARQTVAEQLRPPFRGEIWEYFKDVPMGRSLANKGEPFDINTAFYMTHVMRHIRTSPYGKTVCRAGIQMLKTHGAIELPCGYFIGCDPGDMILYFPGDNTAYDQAKSRTLDHLKKQPQIDKLIQEVINASSAGRFNITNEAIYLPNMVLRIWPLNESTTNRITVRYVMISDAFMSKRTGLLKLAMGRVTQHDTKDLRDYKIIIESQGGEDDDDFDAEWKDTDQRLLHVVCPLCKTGQVFDWHRERGSDFVPVPPSDIVSLDHQSWIDHNRPILVSKERRHSGMKRGDDVKLSDGTYDERAVAERTHFECYHCGGAWQDTKETRYALDHSSYYVPSHPTAIPENVGFWWPQWAGQRLRWGKIMLKYLQAKQSAALGNQEPIKQFWQQRAARSWNPMLERTIHEVAPSSYDIEEKIPNEVARNMAVDVQQNQDIFDETGKSIGSWFWAEAEAVDRFGNTRQIHRGFHKSWESWIKVQKDLKIPNDRVCIDVGHWPTEIMQRAAQEAERRAQPNAERLPVYMREKNVTWILCLGSDQLKFKHEKNTEKAYSTYQYLPVQLFDAAGNRKIVILKKIQWSNYAFKHQLDFIRSGAPGAPRREILPREKLDALTQAEETGYRTYEAQMENENLIKERGKDKYVPVRPDVHYRDTSCMLLCRQAIDGGIGHQAMGAAEGQSG